MTVLSSRLLTVVLSLTAFALVGGPLVAPRLLIAQGLASDRPRYELSVELAYESASLVVSQETTIPNASAVSLDRAVFQVIAASVGTFELFDASVDGTPVRARLEGTVLDVPFPAPAWPNERRVVSLHYRLRVPPGPGRLSAGPRAMALGGWFPLLAPHRGDWLRRQYVDVGDAFASDLADFDVIVRHRAGLQVVGNGQRQTADTGATRFRASGVRDVALAVSPDYVESRRAAGDVEVVAHAFTAERADALADLAARYLAWYGQPLRQPYPYPNLVLAEVDLPASYGGMEYPGLIFLSRHIPLVRPVEGSLLDLLVGHEVAHQWFYALVGNDQVQDPWLDEAFATYLPYEYYRANDPATYGALWYGRFLPSLGPTSRPVSASVYDFPDDGPYFAAVYRRGARMLDDLRQELGDAAFQDALAEHVATFAGSLASPAAVLEIYQRHASRSLNPLLRRYLDYPWLVDPEPARWNVELPAEPVGDELSLFVGADFPLPRAEVWLDARKLYDGPRNSLRLPTGLPPGDVANPSGGPPSALLLVRVEDHRGIVYEKARRVRLAPPPA